MKIKQEQVERTAELARLELDPEKLNHFMEQFQELLNYFEQLQEVDTSAVEPLYQPSSGQQTPFREDRVISELTHEEALREAPDSAEGYFKVPRIIES